MPILNPGGNNNIEISEEIVEVNLKVKVILSSRFNSTRLTLKEVVTNYLVNTLNEEAVEEEDSARESLNSDENRYAVIEVE